MSEPQKPKDLGMKARPKTSAGIETQTEDEIVVERFLNKGMKVTLSDGTSLTLKELPAWDMLDLAQPLLKWISKFRSTESGDTLDVVSDLMVDKDLRQKLFDIFAAFARTTDTAQFEKMLTRDITALISGIRQVVKEEEAEALFLALGTKLQ
jgi:hypothetical protein